MNDFKRLQRVAVNKENGRGVEGARKQIPDQQRLVAFLLLYGNLTSVRKRDQRAFRHAGRGCPPCI